MSGPVEYQWTLDRFMQWYGPLVNEDPALAEMLDGETRARLERLSRERLERLTDDFRYRDVVAYVIGRHPA